MSSREERQAYTKRWKRVKREFAQLEQAEQQRAHLHKEQLQQEQPQPSQLQLAHECEEVSDLVAMPAGSVCSSEEDNGSVYSTTDLDICDVPMDGLVYQTSDSCNDDRNIKGSLKCFLQHWALKHQIPHSALHDLVVGLKAIGHPGQANEMDTKAMRTYIDRIAQRVDQVQGGVNELLTRVRPQSPRATAEDDILLSPCRSVTELEELDQSLNQQERRNKMQRYLSTLGGQSGGIAIRRMLRQVATNDVLSQYSLRGRKSKRAFQDLSIYRIITGACQKSFPLLTAAEIEDLTGQALKFAPHRQRPSVKD